MGSGHPCNLRRSQLFGTNWNRLELGDPQNSNSILGYFWGFLKSFRESTLPPNPGPPVEKHIWASGACLLCLSVCLSVPLYRSFCFSLSVSYFPLIFSYLSARETIISSCCSSEVHISMVCSPRLVIKTVSHLGFAQRNHALGFCDITAEPNRCKQMPWRDQKSNL